jgi:hydrogenase/urease accessory protein HupE
MRWLLALLLIVVAPCAHADELRPGYLEFTQHSATDWRLVWKAPMRGGVTPVTQPVLPDGCRIVRRTDRAVSGTTLVTASAVTCPGTVSGKTIGLSNFAASQTDVLVRVAPLGRPVQALRLTAASPMAEIAARPDRWQVAWTYFVIGIEHIVFGFDHLLFVVSLVLLLTGGWAVAKAVTAFTVAHSITLIGTTLGVLGLPQRPVESVIALSIVFLAVEIAKKRPDALRLSERVPWIVAFLFGLLHGFGFAGALQDIGLPESEVPTALLTFNLGVEAGQLAIVLLCFGLLALIKRAAPAVERPVVVAATYAIGGIASFWFIERTLV